TAATNSNGQATLSWLPTTTSFSANTGTITPPAGSNLAPTSFTIPPTNTDTTLTVTLQPPVTMSGVVRDGAGQPLAGVRVTLQQPFPATNQSGAPSAADGSYSLPVAPGSYRLNLSPNPIPPPLSPPFTFNLFGSTILDLTADRSQDITIPIINLTVNAVDSAAVPVANATVQANASNGVTFPVFPGY